MDIDGTLESELVLLCQQPAGARSDRDVRFIRDRLHEMSPFFKLWPPKLQRLLAQLASSQRLVKGEVFFSPGDEPKEIYFLVVGQASKQPEEPACSPTGRVLFCSAAQQLIPPGARADPDVTPLSQATICVRHPAGAGRLKSMASLRAGDTFGESALMVSFPAPAGAGHPTHTPHTLAPWQHSVEPLPGTRPCLQDAPKQTAFVRVESDAAVALTVNADALARMIEGGM